MVRTQLSDGQKQCIFSTKGKIKATLQSILAFLLVLCRLGKTPKALADVSLTSPVALMPSHVLP